jgi:acetyl-CoA carboxylase biotin carboxyl carrier protein
MPVAAVAPPVAAPAAAPAAAPVAEAPSANPASHPGAVTSPMVGTVYTSPEPDAPAFISEGDTVKAGQTLFIVEAMKVMNPITAPKAGKISTILVQNAQPVEFGEALVIVE